MYGIQSQERRYHYSGIAVPVCWNSSAIPAGIFRKEMKKIIWTLAVLPTIVTAVALKFMPDTVPLHYNFAGEIDRWGSKYEHFLMPALLIVFVVLMQVITYFQEKKIEDEPTPREQASRRNNIKVVRIVTVVFEIFWLILICWMLWTSKENANIETAQTVTNTLHCEFQG